MSASGGENYKLFLTHLGVDMSASGVENYQLFQACKASFLQI
jgi:hypothetical protein